MKVLGISGNGVRTKYICEVDHIEIEKFMNLYYNNLKILKPGDDIDLGKGHEYHHKTKEALKKTKEFFESHADVIRAITDGLLIVNMEEYAKN